MNKNQLKNFIKSIINEQLDSKINILKYKPTVKQVKQLERDFVSQIPYLSKYQLQAIYSNVFNKKPCWILFFIIKEWKMNRELGYSFKIYPTIENNYIYYDEKNVRQLKGNFFNTSKQFTRFKSNVVQQGINKHTSKIIWDIQYDT